MRRLLVATLTAALVASAAADAGATEHTTDPVPPLDAVPITVGAPPHEARLDEFDEVDWYRFDAAEGQDYWIVIDTGGNRSLPAVDAWLSLHDATGARVDVTSASDDDELRWKLLAGAEEATYFVRVFTNRRSYVLTGRYGLAVHAIDDDHGDTPAKETAIDVADTAGATGTIDHQDDVDWFRFSAEAGDLYRMTAPDTVEMSLQLLFATGDDAAAADERELTQWGTDRGPDDLEGKPWLFAVSGRYAMSIEALSGEQGDYPRPYAVDFEMLTDDHLNTPQGATPLPVGEEILASHDYRLDEDWFSVDLVDGASYVAELSRSDRSSSDLSIDLFGSARGGRAEHLLARPVRVSGRRHHGGVAGDRDRSAPRPGHGLVERSRRAIPRRVHGGCPPAIPRRPCRCRDRCHLAVGGSVDGGNAGGFRGPRLVPVPGPGRRAVCHRLRTARWGCGGVRFSHGPRDGVRSVAVLR